MTRYISPDLKDCDDCDRTLYQDYGAETFEKKPIIFGDFMKMGADTKDRVYEDIQSMEKLIKVLNDVRFHVF